VSKRLEGARFVQSGYDPARQSGRCTTRKMTPEELAAIQPAATPQEALQQERQDSAYYGYLDSVFENGRPLPPKPVRPPNSGIHMEAFVEGNTLIINTEDENPETE
jgi:hypothetical protein